ncbi:MULTISPECIES: 3-methyl-2-oxobutanoate hydroxymethyltransferase [Legionella]|uniref:3-methyl-2-oxobutanoate hydroxymethyltransferase n=1 Tax=Legionella septentrionalis TaxID=2498109 RepID=A0A3S0WSV6_9GAMM|nr:MULTISPECIES: 3-methyl-2-oxobutanoate hydroxymethyltransferase [Legionella]MCP0913918.1 3-methyl-2-oxobutanoate hydroxymethyltransferase [Legionella sp. 27cVA30]RUQ90417.1 3-methyl-2-oxobutanoate hydroxymethyltransferase [Legionella septentrionalis]RUR00068.1 3-methyl-2-oxobutanoate hydroxymethyltransferase [Legionella septentrionalis]RUR10764.1 3-methyl-2-oxobutanoate hydroxymethyltransferase [Legionella septentrionalis]RUR16483.1 3-methyl-2-oxobutanoate hydroxymethyltransferase [Legionell
MKIHDFKRKKELNAKISMLTCYDYPSACMITESKVDCVLVGDSLAMTVHGHESTIMATMGMMEMHTAAVARGLRGKFLVSDLPFLSYRISRAETMKNAQRLMQAGANAIKLEGADPDICETISYLVTSGIPVMGHIGLVPQSVHQLGGYVVQGKKNDEAKLLLEQAKQLEAAGCFALVIECVPSQVAKSITASLAIPTIGIGAGAETDGQILVWHDMLGLQTAFKPRFVKHFSQAKELMLQAIDAYVQQVQKTEFPAAEHTF